MSPLEILDLSEDEWLILLACSKVIGDDRERANSSRNDQEFHGYDYD